MDVGSFGGSEVGKEGVIRSEHFLFLFLLLLLLLETEKLRVGKEK